MRFRCQLANQVLQGGHMAGRGIWSRHPKQEDAGNQCWGCQSRESRLRQMVQAILSLRCHQMVLASCFLQSRLTGQELGSGRLESAGRCRHLAQEQEQEWQSQARESACRSHPCKAR